MCSTQHRDIATGTCPAWAHLPLMFDQAAAVFNLRLITRCQKMFKRNLLDLG